MIEHLRAKLRQPLPGREAQYRMAHQIRRSEAPIPDDARKAAVLLLLFPKDDVWHLTFIERSRGNGNDRHAGQISFPGGQFERGDTDMQATALRETEEEIAVPRQHVQLLGSLSELYIPVSNFAVHPFVGFVDYVPDFQPEVSEVQSVLEVPFHYFQDKNNLLVKDMAITDRMILREVPYFDLDGKVLWGATAMILGELLAVHGPRIE